MTGAAAASSALVAEPFLHVTPERIENPLTGRTLARGDTGEAALRRILTDGRVEALDAATREELTAAGWLVRQQADRDPARRFRLRIVSLETHTRCNQACYFCPVSIAPREALSMPDALFDRIVLQLRAFRETLDAVFLSSYNEPTIDPRFVAQVERLIGEGLPVALNTNGTGLTPDRVDRLGRAGTLRLLSVNLSTLDRERYTRERGHDHLASVLRNLDYAGARAVASEMIVAVLGTGDETHHRDFEAIHARFAGSRFDVRFHEVMDRAGYLPIGLTGPSAATSGERPALRGCDNLGSRPLQHLHVTPDGLCVFCCEDYDERYVAGDLRTETIVEVLQGDALARLRRWSYGLDAAPDDFICRRCTFALTR